jgi:hypothetical protein
MRFHVCRSHIADGFDRHPDSGTPGYYIGIACDESVEAASHSPEADEPYIYLFHQKVPF